MAKKKKNNHYLNNTNAQKKGVGKLIRIRVEHESDFDSIEHWLPNPETRGAALMRAVEIAISDDLIATTPHGPIECEFCGKESACDCE